MSWPRLQMEISSNRAGNWRHVSVCCTDSWSGFNLLILMFVLDSAPVGWINYIRPHNIKRKHKLGGHSKRRTHFERYCWTIICTRPELPWICTKPLNLTIYQEKMMLHILVFRENLNTSTNYAVAGKHLHLLFGYPKLKQIVFVCFCVL